MKPEKYINLILGGALFSILISIAAVFFSYRFYAALQRSNATHQQSLQTMQAQVEQLESRLAELQSPNSGNLAAQRDPESRPIVVYTARGADAQQQAALRRLEQIVDSTGLKQLAEGEDVNPDLLQKIYNDYADRERLDAYREQMLEANRQLHRSDEAGYDAELDSLYQRARFRGNTDISPEERDRAFNEMLAKYPEAYATGMVIAERALVAAFRQNTADLENYYNQLSANQKFAGIVTDRGLEAVPNIQYQLARQYINAGRTEEAGLLMESLEKNYADSLLAVRSPSRRRNWIPAGQIVADLRRQME